MTKFPYQALGFNISIEQLIKLNGKGVNMKPELKKDILFDGIVKGGEIAANALNNNLTSEELKTYFEIVATAHNLVIQREIRDYEEIVKQVQKDAAKKAEAQANIINSMQITINKLQETKKKNQ